MSDPIDILKVKALNILGCKDVSWCKIDFPIDYVDAKGHYAIGSWIECPYCGKRVLMALTSDEADILQQSYGEVEDGSSTAFES